MRPGVDVISRALPPPRSAPTDTGVAFLIGPTLTGNGPVLLRSMTEYENVYGDRGTGPEQATWDAADVYFREGGAKLYVSRTNPSTTRSSKAAAADGEAPAPAVLDPTLQPALDALTKDLGPGQVFLADPALAADVANQSALLAHAYDCNRVALLSTKDDADATVLEAAGTALNTDANARYGALFAPSATVPGVVAGTTRTIPYAAVCAGIIARNDVVYSPNQASAGELGQSVFSLDVVNHYTDAEYSSLNDAGVSMARLKFGGVRTYGYRTCVDPDSQPEWLMFGWARLNMAIVAQAEAIGERYVFSQIDGRGHTLSQFNGDLSAMLATYYDQGALYGATPQEAYDVDTGSSVNTPDTIANGELHAVMSVRMSPDAEHVIIEIVKVASNQSLPATVAAVAA